MGIVNREGALYMATGIDNSGLYSGVRQAEGMIGQLESTAKKAGAAMAGYLAFDSLKNVGKEIINVRGEVQMLEKSFNVLLGSESAAMRMLADIKQYAVESPLSLSGVSNAAQTLLGFNIEAERVIPIIKQIGDISMGNQERFKSLILAFSQMSSAGRLMGQDLLQMINAGFNPLQVIAEKTGKSMAQLKKDMEAGAISSETVADAFRQVTEAGGKFYGMTQQQAEGIKGLQAQLTGGFEDAYNKIGKSSEEFITKGYQGAILLVENYEQIGKTLTSMLATYGAYRTAVALNIAMEKGWTVSQLTQYRTLLMVERAQKLLNATMLSNPYVLITTLVMGLVTALWALRDSTTESEKAQKRLSDGLSQVNSAVEERKAKYEELLAVVKDETQTENARLRSLKDLQALYPGIFSNMDIEAVKLADEIKLKKERNKLDEEYNKAQLREKITESKSRYDQLKKEISLIEKGREGRSAFGKIKAGLLREESRAVGNEVMGYISQLRELEKTDTSSSVSKVFSNVSDEVQKTTENITKLKKEIADLRSGKTKASKENETILSLIESKQKELKESEEALATLTGQDKTAIKSGIDANRLKAETAERLAAIKEAQRLFLLQESEGELTIRQERINLMEEGSAKTLEQIQLDYDKRMAEIAKHGDELIKQQQEIEKKIWEASNPDWKEKGMEFKPGTTSIDQLSPALQKQLTDQAGVAGEATLKKQSDLLKQTLTQYQDYAARRLELEKKYNEDVAYLGTQRNEKNGEQINAALVEAKKKLEESLSQINLEEFKEGIDWSTVFGDLSKLSTDSLDLLRTKLATFIKGVGKSMSPEIMKEVADAFNNLELEIADRKPIDQLNRSFTDYKVKAEAVAVAQKKLNDLQRSGIASTADLEKATQELNDAQDSRRKSLVGMNQAVNKIGEKGQQVVNAGNDIVDMLVSLGVEVPEALEGTLQGLGKIMSSLENVDLTKPFSIVTGAVGVLSGLGKMVGSIFGLGKNNDEKLLKEIEKCEELVTLYGKLIDKQKEYISSLTGGAAIKQAEEAAELIQRSLAASRSSLESWFRTGASSNHHSMAYRINRDLKNELKGAGITDIGQVLNFDTSQWEALQKNIELWAKLPEEVRAYGEAVIDAKVNTEQLGDIMREAVTGISFDELKDSLDDIVSMADMTFDDISESFTDHMSKAVLHMVKNQYLTSELKKWYEQFTEYASDEKITQQESDALRKYYSEIAEKGNQLYKQAMELAGIDISSQEENDKSENTLKGAYAKASQESIDLLAGQTGAQRVAIEKILQILQMMSPANRSDFVAGIRADLQMLYDLQYAGWKEVSAIKEISKEIKTATDKIEGYTKEIRDSNKDIKENTESAAESLQNIEQGVNINLPPI